MQVCGVPGRMELQKHLEDVSAALEEIEDGVKDRQDELDSALDKADNFDRTFQVNFPKMIEYKYCTYFRNFSLVWI